jgi:predicted Fe-Mo cluster-binding NifX family protein
MAGRSGCPRRSTTPWRGPERQGVVADALQLLVLANYSVSPPENGMPRAGLRETGFMTTCVPVTADGHVAPGWGRAERVALAEVSDGEITSWQEVDVGWGALHDQGGEGAHHARIVRFLREYQVTAVVAAGMGAGMRQTLGRMRLHLQLGAAADARAAVLAGGAGCS